MDAERKAEMERVRRSKSETKIDERPKSIDVYRSIFERYPKRNVWDEFKANISEDEVTLTRWREFLKQWLLTGMNPVNYVMMLDYFRQGKKPQGVAVQPQRIVRPVAPVTTNPTADLNELLKNRANAQARARQREQARTAVIAE